MNNVHVSNYVQCDLTVGRFATFYGIFFYPHSLSFCIFFSLLHIVVWHKDLSKVYALTELMMRDETQPCLKPFDLPNKLEEVRNNIHITN